MTSEAPVGDSSGVVWDWARKVRGLRFGAQGLQCRDWYVRMAWASSQMFGVLPPAAIRLRENCLASLLAWPQYPHGHAGRDPLTTTRNLRARSSRSGYLGSVPGGWPLRGGDHGRKSSTVGLQHFGVHISKPSFWNVPGVPSTFGRVGLSILKERLRYSLGCDMG